MGMDVWQQPLLLIKSNRSSFQIWREHLEQPIELTQVLSELLVAFELTTAGELDGKA